MFQASCLPIEDWISLLQSVSWTPAGMWGAGACWTANISASPNDASGCSLLQVLKNATTVPRRFSLSPRAARGILRRATKRGRTLPIALQQALEVLEMGTDKAGTPTTPPALCADGPTDPTATNPDEAGKTI